MDDPVVAVVAGREIRRSEVVARCWRALDATVEWAKLVTGEATAVSNAESPHDLELLPALADLEEAHAAADGPAFRDATLRFVEAAHRLEAAGVLEEVGVPR